MVAPAVKQRIRADPDAERAVHRVGSDQPHFRGTGPASARLDNAQRVHTDVVDTVQAGYRVELARLYFMMWILDLIFAKSPVLPPHVYLGVTA